MKVRLHLDEARLRRPLISAGGSVASRGLVVVMLEAEDGTTGIGEAAPLPGYHGVSLGAVLDALRACEPALAVADRLAPPDAVARCAELTAVPQALAAIDMALWDVAAKRAGEPVWRLLGASQGGEVQLNATIGAVDRAGAAREASRALAAGFEAVKVKVGIGDDAGRLAAARAAAGRDVAIRIDANGAWTAQEAIANLRALAPVGIECCEEPARGVAAIASVAAASEVPVSMDESATQPGALDQQACRAVCLKISACGGMSGLIRAAERARRVGYEVYIASTLDGPLGIAAALHAAAAVSPERHCGLATLELFERADPLPAREGRLGPPDGPGLGGPWLDWYSAK
jgi:L-alanine-DL-glutamate epimerase-like enolase superfamily enzyme